MNYSYYNIIHINHRYVPNTIVVSKIMIENLSTGIVYYICVRNLYVTFLGYVRDLHYGFYYLLSAIRKHRKFVVFAYYNLRIQCAILWFLI